MAEQINKNDYINHPDRIGGFNYYSLGETTIKQLQQNNLISSKTRKFQNKKPDAIVTDDEKDIVVYIENKDIGLIPKKIIWKKPLINTICLNLPLTVVNSKQFPTMKKENRILTKNASLSTFRNSMMLLIPLG